MENSYCKTQMMALISVFARYLVKVKCSIGQMKLIVKREIVKIN